MGVFEFIFYLGVISIIFTFVWKWVFVLPLSFLGLVFGDTKYWRWFIKTLGSYILASLTAVLTLAALQDEPTLFRILLLSFTGAFVILMGLASNQYEKEKEARQNFDFNFLQLLREDAAFDLFLLLGTVCFYIFVLFIPFVANNVLIISFFNVIQWAYNLPIIGWIIAIGGAFFLLNTIIHGIFALGAIFVGLTSVLKDAPRTEVVSVENKPS